MKKKLILVLLIIVSHIACFAQEGMWLLNQVGQLDLNKKGLKINVSDIYNPKKPSLFNAVVQLGGGTASFVSSNGLLITNHHVAYEAIQKASTAQKDYLKNGFLANSYTEEIPATGFRALMLKEMKDVTDELKNSVKEIKDIQEKSNEIAKKISEMRKKYENGQDDVLAVVSQMYNGKQYILFVYKVIKDIRLVYAPPSSIGNYGGEIDNWMWPRHTGDFSFMRAYVSKDGKGTEYNAENVPFKPEKWLKPAKDFLKDGDFTFILGFPGQTTRYRTSVSANWNLTENYPFTIKNYKEIIDILESLTKNDREGQLKVANLSKGLANTLKNFQGKVEGMKKTDFVTKKINFEKQLMDWVNTDKTRKEKYGNIINEIKSEYKILKTTKDKENVLGVLQGLAGAPLGSANTLYYFMQEICKPENERSITEKDINELIENTKTGFNDYYEPAEKALFIRALKMVKELPEDQKINELNYIVNNNSITIEQFADEAFRNSKLTSFEKIKELFRMKADEIKALNDPFVTIIEKLQPVFDESNNMNQRFNLVIGNLRKQYIEALYEWKGSNMYPDANGTMRFTWGKIKGYEPADAVWYYPFTSLKGVVAKNTDADPFDAPKELVNLYKNKDFGRYLNPGLKDVPVAFTHECDITGGNSGSPVMNSKGELIGVAFDGNYEAMIGDWQYDPEIQRTISVDIHYVLFILEKFAKASSLLSEMGIK